jgi:hypothetical protein
MQYAMSTATATQANRLIAAYECMLRVQYLLSHVYRSCDGYVFLCSVISGGNKTNIKPSFITQLQLTVDYKYDTLIFESC